jgi:multiple sugar transport system ATP-binding protein
MNFVVAERTGDDIAAHGTPLAVPDALRARLGSGALLYGLRPEAIALADDGLHGTVLMVEPTGPETYVVVETALGALTARVPGRLAHVAGDRVSLAWRAEDAHVFDAASERRIA